jgi:hypothetical protein
MPSDRNRDAKDVAAVSNERIRMLSMGPRFREDDGVPYFAAVANSISFKRFTNAAGSLS